MKPKKQETSYRTVEAVIHLPVQGKLRNTMIGIFSSEVTAFGLAVREVLEEMARNLELPLDQDKKLKAARLSVQISGPDIPRAKALLEKEMTEHGYTNSYRIVDIQDSGTLSTVDFEIASVKESKAVPGKNASVRKSLNAMPANFLAQVIRGWCRYPVLKTLSATGQVGVAQKVAEQILSFLQLIYDDSNNSFPSIGERSPEIRLAKWLQSLEGVRTNYRGFEYKKQREIDPSIPENDPRGDRRVNVDENWIDVTKLPTVDRFPYFYANNDVVVYERTWKNDYGNTEKRFYAWIPFGNPAEEPRLLWWKSRASEFASLPSFAIQPLSKKKTGIVVPLSYGENFEAIMRDQARQVKWTVLAEKRTPKTHDKCILGTGVDAKKVLNNSGRCGQHGANLPYHEKQWVLQFATSMDVDPKIKPNTLGVTFNDTPSVSWSLADSTGKITTKGSFAQESVLDFALVKKEYLENAQRNRRWVGGVQFNKELRRRTIELAKSIVNLAGRNDANIVIEEIDFVQKSGMGPGMNSRHSLWNYSDLPKWITHLATDRTQTYVKSVHEYRLKFECPHCGAMRKAKEKKEDATTYRENGILHCRSCEKDTVQEGNYFSDRIAAIGTGIFRDLQEKLDKAQAKREAEAEEEARKATAEAETSASSAPTVTNE